MAELGKRPLGEPPIFRDLDELQLWLTETVAALNLVVMNVWNTKDEVPTSPWEGCTGVATYSPADGNGVYIYANGAWTKVTTAATTTFPT